MAFLAVNADSIDSQYSELRQEYEQVLKLCKDDLHGAWKRISQLLDGELFAEGPKFRYQAGIRELQKGILTLAIDLSSRIDKDNLFELLLETVDWFPEEPFFWIKLADNTEKSYKGTIIKRIALSRAVELLPLEMSLRIQLSKVKFALGRPETAVLLEEKPYFPLESETLHCHILEIDATMKLSRVIEMVCDLAEEILEIHAPKKGRAAAHSLTKVRLSVPLVIVFIDRKSTQGGDPYDDNTLQLSQAGSVKNLNDYSQTSIRSQRRRLRARELTAVENKITTQELSDQLLNILLKIRSNPNIDHYFDAAFRLSAESSGELEHQFIHLGDQGHDPLASYCFQPGNSWLAKLLADICLCLEQHGVLDHPTPFFYPLFKRLAFILFAGDVDFFLSKFSLNQLFWLTELLLAEDLQLDKAKYLLLRLRVKIDILNDQQSFIRYLWLQYRIQGNISDLCRLELLFAMSCDDLIVKLSGDFDGEKIKVLTSATVVRERLRIERIKLLAQVKQIHSSSGKEAVNEWIAANINDPISWLKMRSGFEDIAEWSLLLIDYFENDREISIQLLIMGLVSSLLSREDLSIRILSRSNQYSSILISLQNHTTLLERLVLSTCHTPEFLSCLVSLFVDENLMEMHSEFLIVVLRDCADHDILSDSQKLESIVNCLSDQDQLNNSGKVLFYCSLSIFCGCPFLDIQNDEWNLAKSLQNVTVDNPRHDIRSAILLQTLISDLVDMETVDPARIIPVCDYLLSILFGELEKDTNFLSTLRYLEDALTKIWKPLNPPLIYTKSMPVIKGLLDLYEIKYEAFERRSAPKKKKAVDMISSMITELYKIASIQPDQDIRPHLFLKLRELFDAELRQLLIKDAAVVLERSQYISQLVCGVHNSLRFALLGSRRLDSDSLDLVVIEQFYNSVADAGVLSWFVSLEAKRHMGLFVLSQLEKFPLSQWQHYRMKAIALRLAGKEPSSVTSLKVKSLTEYLETEKHQNPDLLYYLICEAIDGILRIRFTHPVVFNSLFATLKSSLSSVMMLDNSQSINGQLLAIFKEIGTLDKKHIHHLHLALQTRLSLTSSSTSLDHVKHLWGMLVTVLIKPKSNHLLNVWQTDQDYSGDFHYYSELYMRESSKAIICSRGSTLDKANLLAMMIGRISSATNIFIRRRRLLKDLLLEFESFVKKTSDDQDSLVDFQDSVQLKAALQDILEDAMEVVCACGVELI